ncbi:MAG: TetR/AcrR family transcriptional regulator [Thiobacillus sp.]|uniref:TetR/AcrR family transcriptional regulator n=1 Tax=Hydrogenophaga sp. TaxID=1904254 RepID=UPI0008AF3D5B|nr:TetR/AcrR family transcriptional regulator [Hydrogenophaga sp.]MBU4182390.1 TetR/AcrR family transcriptional regulator [Gammaproteobacteria bacterium]MBW8468396.1 TetR/AcrR family transcriptional regulator [Thiobacillus sp.]OGB31702.1 MAG: TetR family transcriptional regulator [Burkholderiales bacterium RIFCSPLOWO2_02_FULL_66_35]MBU4278919.1 TetR/AcrR family transcriptional regulator [Gammaproteobacteria bacterium]MBU4325611.1 TetR/AcrR family transcriptional regulator [Gammaproteobacteria 
MDTDNAQPSETDQPRRSRGRPRKSEDERDDGNRRQALMRAAAKLFRQYGFAATSTRDIATAAGMRSGSPFYHFENKEALLAGVMHEGMQSALRRQTAAMDGAAAAGAAAGQTLSARECLRVLVRNHLEVLLGPDSDFIPVMLYEWRSLSEAQRSEVNRLKADYEAAWVPVLRALHASGELKGEPGLARLMLFGALNWSVQWFDPDRQASLDDLTQTTLLLFLKDIA